MTTQHQPPTEVIKQLIERSLELFLYEDAKFYAEMLHTVKGDLGSLLELGNVTMKIGDMGGCVRLLRHYYPFQEHFQVRAKNDQGLVKLQYLYGVCLVHTHRYQEAETVFKSIRDPTSYQHQAGIAHWLGHIKRFTCRETHALESFAKCIHMNPFSWSAIEGLVECSGKVNTMGVLEPVLSPEKCDEYTELYFSNVKIEAKEGQHDEGTAEAPSTPTNATITPKKLKKTPTTAPSKINSGRKAVGKPISTPQKQPAAIGGGVVEQTRTLLFLLHKHASLLVACSSYNFNETLTLINDFPAPFRHTGYIQGLLAKAFYDEGLYTESCNAFETLRRMEPHRLDPKLMYYSSCLWQLQRDKQLAHLSQELIQMDKLSVVTQVVLGNTHSVVGEHDGAIQFLQRACNIDKYHVYASALKGMEHLVLEELDDAVQAFRAAIRLDPRQYTAWHGLGSVAAKQEKWKEAAEHFKRACTINPNPPLLLAYANVLMEESTPSCTELALNNINRVLVHQPNHSLARLRKGEALLRINRLPEAKEIALSLLETSPKEAKVNLLLGRVYRRLGDKIKALQYFNFALGLDPKDTPGVRYEVDKYHDELDSGEE